MATHDSPKPAATATSITSPAQRASEQTTAEPQAERTALSSEPQLAGRLNGQQQARMMQRMQRTVGNAQVQRMVRAASTQQRATNQPRHAAANPAILPIQRTSARTTQTQPGSAILPAATSALPAQRTPAPIARGFLNDVKNWGANKLQQGAKAVFEQALRTAGVDARRVMGLINRAGGAVGSIISNPGRFANTLINAVRQGFGKFQGNISTHLQSGFSGWLFGTMSGAGVSMPKDLSAPSVLSLVLQVLNITPAALKQRVGRQIGDQNVARMEQAWGVIGTAMKSGPGGLWTMLKEYLGDLQTLVIGGIKEWVISSVIRSAVIKIASMFNPASGIVAAVKLIYDVVTFLIERASQISALFQAIGDSVGALAQGNTQQAAAKIEQVLARMIPVAIGFMASLAGLRGIAQKVKEIIGRVRDRVQAAIDKMIAKVLSRFRGSSQPGAAQSGQPAAGKKPINLARRFSMSGERHTLYVQQKNGRLVVDMASRRDQLKSIVNKAIDEEQGGAKRNALLTTLHDILLKLNELLEYEKAGSYSNMPEAAIRQWTDAIATVLEGLGKQYRIHDLEHLGHPSKFVEGDELKDEYKKVVRETFYPSGYWDSTHQWKAARLAQLTHPSNPSLFRDEITNTWEPKRLNGKDNVTIDHTMKVVDHWNSTGHKQTQDERAAFYNDTSKLQLAAHKNNCSDGAQARNQGSLYGAKVGPKFRGPNDTKD